VIADFDAPPRGFSFAVKLVRARTDAPAGTISQEIGGLGAKLKSMFQFNDYALLDSAVIQGVEGRQLSYRLGDEYVLAFSIGAAGSGEELLLSTFALSRVKKDEQGRPYTVPLYRAAITVTLNQTLVVGASKEEGSKNALILILLAQETARPGTPAESRWGSDGPGVPSRSDGPTSVAEGRGGLPTPRRPHEMERGAVTSSKSAARPFLRLAPAAPRRVKMRDFIIFNQELIALPRPAPVVHSLLRWRGREPHPRRVLVEIRDRVNAGAAIPTPRRAGETSSRACTGPRQGRGEERRDRASCGAT
jgi:hypothetical protein